METKSIFKIRNKKTGQFSMGGESPYWDPDGQGKTWNRRGDISAHITLVRKKGFSNFYRDAEVVEGVIQIIDHEVTPVEQWFEESVNRKKVRDAQNAERIKQYQTMPIRKGPKRN